MPGLDLDIIEFDDDVDVGEVDLQLPGLDGPAMAGLPTFDAGGPAAAAPKPPAQVGMGAGFDDQGLPPLPSLDLPEDATRPVRGDATLGFGTGVDAAPLAPPAHLDLGHRAAPILMDVTPHALGVELTGGYSQILIRRHAPIPAEAERVFSTARDDQEDVQIRVCQGESEVFAENEPLGEVELIGLPPGPRGSVRVNVTFQLDASGTLDVKAVEIASGLEQSIRINLLGGADEAELASMSERHNELAGAGRMSDKLAKLDYYTLLGIDARASISDVKRAFRDFARRYHPDRFPEDKAKKRERATAIYRRGSEAYQVLTDPRTRAAYDQALRQGQLRLDPAARDRATRQPSDRPAQRKGPPIASAQARLYFEKGVQAAHRGDWRQCWQLLQSALELEPANRFLRTRLEEVRQRLRG